MRAKTQSTLQGMYVDLLKFAIYIAVLLAILAFAVLWISASEVIYGCTPVGGFKSGNFTVQYEAVNVVAITPEGTDFWVFYPEHLKDRHLRADGTFIALRLPTERFIKNGETKKIEFTKHIAKMCSCPKAPSWAGADH